MPNDHYMKTYKRMEFLASLSSTPVKLIKHCYINE
jgi:hypothetical protein